MAWPAQVAAHQTATANQYNGLLDAVQHWGGDVDAATYQLKNLTGIQVAAGGVIDASAGGMQIKGGLTVSSGGALVIATPTQTLTIGDRGDGYICMKESSGVLVLGDESLTTGQIIVTGKQPVLQLNNGRGAAFSASLTVRLGVTAGAYTTITDAQGLDIAMPVKVQGLQVANAAAISIGSDWQSFTPGISSQGNPPVINGVDALYFRLGALCLCYFTIDVTTPVAAELWVNLPLTCTGNGFGLVASGVWSATGGAARNATGYLLNTTTLAFRTDQGDVFAAGWVHLSAMLFYPC